MNIRILGIGVTFLTLAVGCPSEPTLEEVVSEHRAAAKGQLERIAQVSKLLEKATVRGEGALELRGAKVDFQGDELDLQTIEWKQNPGWNAQATNEEFLGDLTNEDVRPKVYFDHGVFLRKCARMIGGKMAPREISPGDAAQAFSQLRRLQYLLVIRNVEHEEPKYQLEQEAFAPGRHVSEAFLFELNPPALLGGFRFSAQNAGQLDFSFSTDPSGKSNEEDRARIALLEDLETSREQAFREAVKIKVPGSSPSKSW